MNDLINYIPKFIYAIYKQREDLQKNFGVVWKLVLAEERIRSFLKFLLASRNAQSFEFQAELRRRSSNGLSRVREDDTFAFTTVVWTATWALALGGRARYRHVAVCKQSF